MNKVLKVAASAALALLVLALWSLAGQSQNERGRRRVPNELLPLRADSSSQQERRVNPQAMSADEKLVRDVYARLMRYQTAGREELAATAGKVSKPEDYLTFELQGFHSGPIEKISGRPLLDMVTARGGAILSIKPTHLNKGKEPPHAYYEAEWATASNGDQKIRNRTVDDNQFAGLNRYTSYEVIARLGGRERTYKALALYQVETGGGTEQEGSTRPAKVEILDNIASEMNTVLKDESPRVRSPWSKYVKSSLYLAVVRLIRETTEAGKTLIPADAPIGYLPGDNVTAEELADARSVLVSNSPCAACTCPTPLSDAEWNFLHGEFPNLVRSQTCKLAPATGTYNCLAWTIDDTSRWWWLEADANGNGHLSVAELNAFYSARGKSNIAYYGTGTGDVLHVAKKAGGSGPDCSASSKLGENIRMGHDLNQLQGGSYSNIVGGN